MPMAARRFFLAICALWTLPAAHSEFVLPLSSVGDYEQSWMVDETMNIKWKSGWSWGNGTQPERCDMWIMWAKQDGYHERLLEDISLNSDGKLDWKINVTSERATEDPRFVLRFVNHTGSSVFPTGASPMQPSRQFYLYPVNAGSASNSPSTSPSTAQSTPPSTSTTSSSQTTTSSTSQSGSSDPGSNPTGNSSNNVGAIAGGVVGGVAGIFLIIGGVVFLLRRRKKSKVAEMGQYDTKGASVHAYMAELHHYEPPELHNEPPELHNAGAHHHRHELPGSTTVVPITNSPLPPSTGGH